MIGKEDLNEEEPVLKVTDKRKFNADGSLREGVKLEEEKPTPAEEPPIIESAETTAKDDLGDLEQTFGEETTPDEEESEMFTTEGIPGADDPASFVNFLSTLVSQAAASLGAMPHPVTGQRSVDLETGKYWIDVLAMLRQKTEGNLHPQEKQLFEGLLSDLQLQYVSLAKASEEKLKAQAAQKFSSKDILGG